MSSEEAPIRFRIIHDEDEAVATPLSPIPAPDPSSLPPPVAVATVTEAVASAKPIDVSTAVNSLMLATPRLAALIIRGIFIITHLTMAVIALSVAWLFQISPKDLHALWSRLCYLL